MMPAIRLQQGLERVQVLDANTHDMIFEESIPQGLIRSIYLKLFSSAFALGGGANVAQGEQTVIRSLTVKSNLHGTLYQNIDGKTLYRFLSFITGVAPATAAAAGGVSCEFPIPFGFLGSLRHPAKRLNDSSLWSFTTKPIINLTIGALTDLVAGGAPNATLNVRPLYEVEANPNPLAEDPKAADPVRGSGDRPKFQVECIVSSFPALQLAGINEVNLPIGRGRIPAYIMVYERNSGTDAEVADVFTARTSNIELRHGGDVILQQTKVTDLDERMSHFLGMNLTAGYHMIPMMPDGKFTDSIQLDGFTEFKLSVDNLGVAAARSLRVLQFNLVPVNAGAEPENQKA